MSILEQQLIVSDKVVSNDITTDPEARSLTMRNGYYVDYKYPDNRSTMTGENPFSGTDSIAISKTAGQLG
jgi:hypothetical protein